VLTAGVHRLRVSGGIPGTLVLFGVLTACNPIAAIVDAATILPVEAAMILPIDAATILPIDAAMILPIDLNRQNDAGSGCHQHHQRGSQLGCQLK
jgi:hypothetical protein